MSIALWSEKQEDRERLLEIQRGLVKLGKQLHLQEEEIKVFTGSFESLCEGRQFWEAEIIFAYFPSTGEAFCRFLISHRRYTEKTVFLFGQSYGCFDPGKIRDYYRMSREEYLMIPARRDYFYEAGLKELLCLLEKTRENRRRFSA